MNKASFFNRIWIWSQWRAYRGLLKACRKVEAVQANKLKAYLRKNAQSKFGLVHGFSDIRSYAQYARQVPIQKWEDIQLWIDKILEGQGQVLFQEDIVAFEETSGTSSMAKWVPYNASLKKEFQQAVAAWIYAMYRSHPRAFSGPSYWSLSPATREKRQSPQGIPLGMDSDGDYFDPLTRFFLSNIWAVSPSLAREKDPQTFYLQTLKELLMAEKLSMISVWSPSFLLQLDNFLQKNTAKLIEWLGENGKLNTRRREFVKDQLETGFTWQSLFPNLCLLSCWTHAQAGLSLPILKQRLGGVKIQGKGLLATEGVTSIPIHPALDPVLSLQSHFYEFRSVDTGEISLAHELRKGATYELILTTGGGLYRYASGDWVKVTGFFHAAPCFEFVGRGNKSSDLVGEKLSEQQVISALQHIPPSVLAKLHGQFISPTRENPHRYQLFLCPSDTSLSGGEMKGVCEKLEGELKKNPYYAQALRLGQLAPMEVLSLAKEDFMALEKWLKKRRKIKDGDFKMPVLFPLGELEGWKVMDR